MGEDPLGEEIAMRSRDRHGNPPLRGPADRDRVTPLPTLASRCLSPLR